MSFCFPNCPRFVYLSLSPVVAGIWPSEPSQIEWVGGGAGARASLGVVQRLADGFWLGLCLGITGVATSRTGNAMDIPGDPGAPHDPGNVVALRVSALYHAL